MRLALVGISSVKKYSMLCFADGMVTKEMHNRLDKTCHLRSLFWTTTCLVRPLYEVYLLCNSLYLMFILPLLCEATGLLWPFSVEKSSGFTKQVLLYRILADCPTPIFSTKSCDMLKIFLFKTT